MSADWRAEVPRRDTDGRRAAGREAARVRVHTSGSGPVTFVLVHGIGVSSRYFRPLAAELARDATVHSLDLPGHGGVPKPKHALSVPQYAEAAWAALADIGVRHPVLVGHSMGAQVVVEMASMRSTVGGASQERAHAAPAGPTVLSADQAPESSRPPAADKAPDADSTSAAATAPVAVSAAATAPVAVSAAATAPDAGRTPAAVVLLGPTNYPAERGFWRQALRLGQDTMREPPRVNWIVFTDYLFRCGLPWYLKTVPAMLGSRIEDAIGEVSVPIVVVRGAGDPIVPAAWATAIARLAPRGTVAEVGGESHVLMYRSAAAVAALCRAAVAR